MPIDKNTLVTINLLYDFTYHEINADQRIRTAIVRFRSVFVVCVGLINQLKLNGRLFSVIEYLSFHFKMWSPSASAEPIYCTSSNHIIIQLVIIYIYADQFSAFIKSVWLLFGWFQLCASTLWRFERSSIKSFWLKLHFRWLFPLNSILLFWNRNQHLQMTFDYGECFLTWKQ